ncbi:T9SS type A sorting domain-containing protein [uncultured Pontibacter sp.]|uniref:beta strand repeat-containing protein n=1 Tax=uncultured Pontibacter sp. TaxID=453356 RepID=UPI00262C35E6|nr:T9SS type A sorting domain-containing protein [uncultured Pontibacter sp.]
MNKNLHPLTYVSFSGARSIVLLLFLTVLSFSAFGQTPGIIYSPATAGGAKVLDPDGNGYVSRTASGFPTSTDEGASSSEIPYRVFPALLTEPLGDLNTGSSGGHTDLAPPATPIVAPSTGSPISAYFNGSNLMFRIRLGGASTASKGYSVLIDSNNKFDGTGTNPGFEFEVLLASNFAVQILKHTPTGSSTIFSGSVAQYSQKAVAASTSGGNTDYFYDFYVPISAFNGEITASTPLRMSGITITSAQSGITGTVSDVGGVNFQAYNYDAPAAWRALINAFPPTTLSQLNSSGFVTSCPTITGPLLAGSRTVSGTTTATTGPVTINVYSGGSLVGTTSINNSASWTVTLNNNATLTAGSIITASAKAGERAESSTTCSQTTVSSECNRPPAPSVIIANGRGSSTITTANSTVYPSVTFNLYQVTSTPTGINRTLYNSITVANASSGTINPSSGNKIPDGEIYATITVNGCESGRSNYVCNRGGNTTAPTLTTNPITPTTTQITGTTVAGALVTLIANNLQVGNSVTATSTGAYTINLQQPLALGQQVYTRIFVPDQCSSTSAVRTVTAQTTAPTITGTYCGPTINLAGTSTEPVGTTIQLFVNGNPLSTTGTPTVNQNGFWSATLSTAAQAGSNITARATAPNKTQSLSSEAVTITAQTPISSLTINAPIVEGATSISGTGPANAKITLYIEGTPFPTSVTVGSDGKWTVSGISPLELFAGASVTATVKATDQCESAKATPVIVSCTPPSSAPAISPTATTICVGSSATVSVSNSEQGVSYRLVTRTGTSPNFTYTDAGNSVIGTGGTITLTSTAITAATTLSVRARKITGTACEVYLGAVSVTVNPLPPNNYGVTISTASGCAATSPIITVSGAQPGFRYELINDATKALITTASGSINPRTGPATTGPISFTVASVSATTTYGIRIVNTSQTNTSCAVENTNKVTYTVTGPRTDQPVTISTTRTCSGGSAIIYITTNNDGFSYQIRRASDNMAIGTAFTGNGQTISRTVTPTATATYYVRVTGNSCTVDLANRVSLEVSAAGPIASASVTEVVNNQPVCATQVSLVGSNPAPGSGVWTITSKPTDNTTAAITAPTSASTTATGLTSGSYTFTWTVTTPNCGNSAASTTVVINCPTSYNIAPPKYKLQYKVNDILATASDVDKLSTAPPEANGVSSASMANSTLLPPGTELLQNGNIRVSAPQSLIPGIYDFSILTVDQKGVSTTTPLRVIIYGEEPAVVPLPVELVYFRAALQQKQVLLKWLTASEENNKEFVVERSADGKSFSAIGTIAGAGTTTQAQQYSFIDNEPVLGTTYYRLKQVDFDGEFAYSNIVFIQANGTTSQEQNLAVWPNPFDQQVTAEIFSKTAAEAIVELSDMQGQQVYRGTVQLKPGFNTLELPFKGLSSGMYILRLKGGDINESAKVIKK